LQLVGPGEDNPDTDHAQVKQQAKVVEVTVVERILVVPFDLKRYPISEAIHFVGWAVPGDLINLDLRVELRLYPSPLAQRVVNPCGEVRAVATAHLNPALIEPEVLQHSQDIGPLVWEVRLEDGDSVPPFVELVVRADEVAKVGLGHGRILFSAAALAYP